MGEQLILVTVAFDLNIEHPYKPLAAALKRLGTPPKQVVQVAWNYVNDSQVYFSLYWVDFDAYDYNLCFYNNNNYIVHVEFLSSDENTQASDNSVLAIQTTLYCSRFHLSCCQKSEGKAAFCKWEEMVDAI